MSKSLQYDLMKDGKQYVFDDYLYKLQKKCFRKLRIINFLPFSSRIRDNILKHFFGSYGNKNVLKNNFTCNFGFNIFIGEGCYINHNVTILDSYEVVIGNNVFIAPNVVISAVTHPNNYSERRSLLIKKVIIEDDVWIGANSVILPGAHIHKGAVIGANSLVKGEVKSNCIYGGVPSKLIKQLGGRQ